MRNLLCIFIMLGICAAPFRASAAADKVLITIEKKRAEAVRGAVGAEGSRAKNEERVFYAVTLKNGTFEDQAGLTVSYIIFVERPKLGEKVTEPSHVDRVTGEEKVDALTRQAPQVIKTQEVSLKTENLVGNYIYSNGGRIKAQDSIVGVWIRVMQNGQTLGESTTPPTVIKRGWEKK